MSSRNAPPHLDTKNGSVGDKGTQRAQRERGNSYRKLSLILSCFMHLGPSHKNKFEHNQNDNTIQAIALKRTTLYVGAGADPEIFDGGGGGVQTLLSMLKLFYG